LRIRGRRLGGRRLGSRRMRTGGMSAGGVSAGRVSAGRMSTGGMSTGRMSAGGMSAGGMSAGRRRDGRMSAGGMSAGGMSAGRRRNGRRIRRNIDNHDDLYTNNVIVTVDIKLNSDIFLFFVDINRAVLATEHFIGLLVPGGVGNERFEVMICKCFPLILGNGEVRALIVGNVNNRVETNNSIVLFTL